MKFNFEGKKVLVTGGANGLGKNIVERFYNEGAEVIAVDKNESQLAKLKEQMPRLKIISLNLCNWEETREKLEHIGEIHHLVNNAGIFIHSKFTEVKKEDIDLLFNVNFKAIINVSQVVGKNMKDGATIVNVSSVLSKVTSHGFGMYSCTKAAVNMLTKSMALELGERGIRVNCVCPGSMNTDMLGQIASKLSPAQIAAGTERLAIKRPVETNETADLVMFLSSEKSSMITGTDVNIDGGLLTN